MLQNITLEMNYINWGWGGGGGGVVSCSAVVR